MQNVLGVKWNIESDVFLFSVVLKENAATQRGVLATVARPVRISLSQHLYGKTRAARDVQTWCYMGWSCCS